MEFELIIKKINHSLSKEEEIIFDNWYNESADHRLYFHKVENNQAKNIELIDAKKAWNSLQKRINSKPKKFVYWKYAAAAALILLLSIPLLFQDIQTAPFKKPVSINNVIKPGTDKAILTLGDGSQIILKKGIEYQSENSKSTGEKIIYETGTKQNTELTYNYLTIPRGGQFLVELGDGTKIWLNSESKIKFPVNFIEGRTREVELVYGEAYFDVSPSTDNKGAKFKVFTKNQEVEVLGTEFNIKAYKEENLICTTLVEGKVTVSRFDETATLIPKQQSIIKTNQSGIVVAKADIYNSVCWKQGIFSFDNMSLKDIMTVLSRWYNINFVFINSNFENTTFTGVLRKNQNIENILKTIKSLNAIHYEIKNNTVFIK